MKIIIYYVTITLAADVVAVLLCLAIERFWPAASLPIFLGLYFGILWGAWVVAVRLTEPEDASVAVAPPGSQPAE
jgi:TctA family transporter